MSHEEVFRFGAGKPVLSTEAHIYPVAIGERGPAGVMAAPGSGPEYPG